MGKAKTIQELNEQIVNKVFSVFSGMDNEYKRLVAEYQDVASQREKYAPKYIAEYKSKIMADIAALKVKYGEQAAKQLEAIESEHTVKKNPKAEPLDTQERLLHEIQRMNNMKLFEAKLQTADINSLKELYDENKDDEDFLTLLDASAKKMPESTKVLLEGHITKSKENPFLDEINKMKYSFKTLVNSELYPSFAEKGLGGLKFRSVGSDLSNVGIFREGWN